ncbi:Kinase/ CMGC CDK [Giardia duodenalis assemblage B]|uniref:cyclin-dependent kinase n=1 Tax=Giardia duodenalis assemblage B TaxID=1394984 RepID=A0A132NQB9_GIAIN|nr:Kinase/ CMGC CDK [Giardia intestinalis assemblage B]
METGLQKFKNMSVSAAPSATSIDRYRRITKLGEGTYGEVYKAIDTVTNETVAIKRIRLEHEEEGVPGTAIREVSLLKELQHRNIIELKSVIHHNHRLHLIFEYAENDLKKYMDKNPDVSMRVIKSFLYQLINGVNFCHSRRCLHRDLKPQNLLLSVSDASETPVLKIGDFGLARAFGIPIRQFTHEIITLWYRPPEILLGSRHYSTSVDIWSIACIWAEMLMKTPLFPGDSEIDQLFKIFEILGLPDDTTWPGVTALPDWKQSFPKFRGKTLKRVLGALLDDEGLDLLAAMLEMDPVKRISAKNALEHPYFSHNDFDP